MHTENLEQRELVLSVSELNKQAKNLLEGTFPDVWVEGEISNFAAPASGHWYFSLKDQKAQVRCAMFRGNQRKLGFSPKDGMHILLKARVSMYEARGEYQLIGEFMEERGEGKLRRAYEALKKKLEADGLFADEHKQPIPVFPKQIGVITSATGAAIRDVLTVLKRRYPCVPIIIYPSLVQGNTAAPTIAKAIDLANNRKECDVLIVTRGGGSLEDLWPFNEEIVAHAIYKSKLPIISAVGHEVDFTIADFVADVRAPTPSAAAEIVAPSKDELLQILYRNKQQLYRQIKTKMQQSTQQLAWMQKHLSQQHPKRRLAEKTQQLDFLELTLTQHINRLINRLQTRAQDTAAKLQRLSPLSCVTKLQNQLQLNKQQLISITHTQVNRKQKALANAAATLDALSPLATLKRGYSIASANGKVLHDANVVQPNDKLMVKLHRGSVECIAVKMIAD